MAPERSSGGATSRPPMAPMDDGQLRTLTRGLIGGFVLYAIGFAAQYLLPEPWSLYVFIGFTVTAMIFSISWFIAVKRGYRLKGVVAGSTRTARKLKERHEHERQKKMKLRR